MVGFVAFHRSADTIEGTDFLIFSFHAGVRTTVISSSNHLIYLPSLIWMLSGMRDTADIDIHLAKFFAEKNMVCDKGAVINAMDVGTIAAGDGINPKAPKAVRGCLQGGLYPAGIPSAPGSPPIQSAAAILRNISMFCSETPSSRNLRSAALLAMTTPRAVLI